MDVYSACLQSILLLNVFVCISYGGDEDFTVNGILYTIVDTEKNWYDGFKQCTTESGKLSIDKTLEKTL